MDKPNLSHQSVVVNLMSSLLKSHIQFKTMARDRASKLNALRRSANLLLAATSDLTLLVLRESRNNSVATTKVLPRNWLGYPP